MTRRVHASGGRWRVSSAPSRAAPPRQGPPPPCCSVRTGRPRASAARRRGGPSSHPLRRKRLQRGAEPLGVCRPGKRGERQPRCLGGSSGRRLGAPPRACSWRGAASRRGGGRRGARAARGSWGLGQGGGRSPQRATERLDGLLRHEQQRRLVGKANRGGTAPCQRQAARARAAHEPARHAHCALEPQRRLWPADHRAVALLAAQRQRLLGGARGGAGGARCHSRMHLRFDNTSEVGEGGGEGFGGLASPASLPAAARA